MGTLFLCLYEMGIIETGFVLFSNYKANVLFF